MKFANTPKASGCPQDVLAVCCYAPTAPGSSCEKLTSINDGFNRRVKPHFAGRLIPRPLWNPINHPTYTIYA